MACLARLLDEIRRFRTDRSGQIAIIFAISSLALMLGVGAGIDLARAYSARQKLSEVATLACQFSTRPSVVQTASTSYTGTNGFQTYVTAVNNFATSSLTSQAWNWATPTGAAGTTGTYFTATPAAGAATTPTNASVTMAANIPTALMQLAHVTQIPVQATINCQTATAAPQIVNVGTILQEGFETSCTVFCFQSPAGTVGTVGLVPTQSFPPSPSYTGSNGYKWYVVGYCLETDITGVINSTSPEGNHTAELDCDNGIGTAGNSSISTKLYLAAGNYELRYNYRSRIDYPDYDPAYICGTTVNDTAYANDNLFALYRLGTVSRTNQINAYLDMNISGTAPLHTTLDGTQQLAGSNLIDECVYSPTWIERSVRITVNTPAFYWLSFAADGQSDSYGGQLDNIRVCPNKCSGTPQDNFPPSWLAANNGNVSKVLFEDTFDLPIYTQDSPPHYIAKGGNLNLSLGTSGNFTLYGWPTLAASGWVTAPYNQITYAVNGAYQGSQYIALDGFNANGSSLKNRSISRPFLLDPGYYQVSYDYISMVTFAGSTATYCFSPPSSGLNLTPQPSATGQIRYYTTTYTSEDTNIVAAFMSSGQLISTPIGGGLQGSLTSYLNPDGSTSTTPTAAPDAVNWNNYNATQSNPAIDVCGYSGVWAVRTVAVKITKPGLYWLTFSANGGTADGNGGGIDDVKLTALGSLYPGAPALPTTIIPVPAPQPDTSYTNSGAFNGFSIVADPQTPPGGP